MKTKTFEKAGGHTEAALFFRPPKLKVSRRLADKSTEQQTKDSP